MRISEDTLRNIVEGALLATGEPVSFERLLGLFDPDEEIGKAELEAALNALQMACSDRGVVLKEVASGWRMQVREDLAPWIARLWQARAPRYTRALLETLAIIAYQQPVTRSDIELVRGVSVSTNIIKTLLERDWVRVVGHRDVPGRPSLYGTTRTFLDYFNLRALAELPPLADIRDLDQVNQEFGFEVGNAETVAAGASAEVISLEDHAEGLRAADDPVARAGQGEGAAEDAFGDEGPRDDAGDVVVDGDADVATDADTGADSDTHDPNAANERDRS